MYRRVRRSLVQLSDLTLRLSILGLGILHCTVTAHILIDTEHSPVDVMDGRTLRSAQTSGSSRSGCAPHSLFSACVLAATQTSLLCVCGAALCSSEQFMQPSSMQSVRSQCAVGQCAASVQPVCRSSQIMCSQPGRSLPACS